MCVCVCMCACVCVCVMTKICIFYVICVYVYMCIGLLCSSSYKNVVCCCVVLQLRRKLMALVDLYQHGEVKDVFGDSSSSVSGADTIK